MSQPSYKNLLKRSRSSVDSIAGRDGIALAHKAYADACEDLFSSHFVKGRAQLHREVSQIPQVASSRSFNRTSSVPTLARAPSFPFDCNKELIRWFIHGGDDFLEHFGSTRRRKCGVDHEPDGAILNRDGGDARLQSAFPFGASSLNVDGIAAIANNTDPVAPMVPMHVNVFGECKSSSHRSSQVDPPASSQVPEWAESQLETPLHYDQQGAHSQGSTAGSHGKVTPTLLAGKASCIARDRCPQFGLLSVCGRRREMEDTCTTEPDLVLLPCNSLGGCRCVDCASCMCSSFHFFGVYDGHGGTQASTFCKARLHKVLIEELIKDVRSHKKSGNGASADMSMRWRRVMEACFLKIDKEVGGICPTGECCSLDGNCSCCVNPIAPDNVGTTAVVAVIGPCQIIVANCGDSRAVLSRGGLVVPLSKDHKPDREDEVNRIVAAGGRIMYWDGLRVGGLLAMSRAIGDRYLKNYVISVPEVTCTVRTKEDECLILASDGLWDVVSSEMACDIARRRLRYQRRKCAKSDNPSAEDSPADAAAALLTKLALSRGSKDNISVIVIDLKSYRKKSFVKC